MSGKNIIFNNKKINKSNFYKNKKPSKIDDIGVNKILVSKRDYDDNNNIRPLCIKLPQMIGYAKYFDDNKTMSFKVSDKNLFKRHTKIWEKISS